MNPFEALEDIQNAYLNYVKTFQRFKNPFIQDWVERRVEGGSLLWKDPYVQLTRRFEEGESFEALSNDSDLRLHPETHKCFTVEAGNREVSPIRLHKHQAEAARSLLAKNLNTIVATGTGSGKSFSFGIPIVSECLRMRDEGAKGIKAVVIYPMNALANSQYDDFATRLAGSGLRLALYTGDTQYSKEAALESLMEITGREEPLDSEVLSREEIKAFPPDILMTNYPMLELILTRFEDQVLFPPEHAGVLKFLVLDEVHTYSGKRGADVACLIRRLKQHTGTIGKLRCIGTSATVQSGEGEDAQEVIADFASKLFGEPFRREAVIGESYTASEGTVGEELSESILVREEIILSYDGSLETAFPLAEALLARALRDEERTFEGLGGTLGSHATLHFLERELEEGPRSIRGLVEKYRSECRPDEDPEACFRELKAGMLLGLLPSDGDGGEARLVPKLHAFFSQGRAITGCLTPEGPHLSGRGETVCAECSDEEHEIFAFPLNFCRACGQEFYGVAIETGGSASPRDMDSTEYRGVPAYLYPEQWNREAAPMPENWLTQAGNVQKKYAESVPQNVEYCPRCMQVGSECECRERMEVCLVPYPLLLCPSCGVTYDRRSREFNKLFTFGTVGRSTATDILIAKTLSALPDDQRKIIAFSDNRQDTALQAAHLNNLQKRLHFRSALCQALADEGALKGSEAFLELAELGVKVFRAMEESDTLPQYATKKGKFSKGKASDRRYQRYLEYATLMEVTQRGQLNQQGLEDVGLLFVGYDGLKEFAAYEEAWEEIPALRDISAAARHDYLQGFLDIMRRRRAVGHPSLSEPEEFRVEVLDRLDESALFYEGGYGGGPAAFSDEALTDAWSLTVYRFRKSPALRSWTQRALGVSKEEAPEIIVEVVKALSDEDAGFLSERHVKRVGKVWAIPADYLTFEISEETEHLVCPKCGTVQHFEEITWCTSPSCGSLEVRDFSENYFREEYARPLKGQVIPEAEEHSAQVDGQERKKIEERFRNLEDQLNVLVCTPTMELGIDIGHLSAVYMRNVPPSPSNYAQRAGRAGRRKGQASLVTVFCGVGTHRGPHDQYFYRNPERMISGRITPPRFLLDNQLLVRTHLHSLILEVLGRGLKLPQKPKELLDIAQVDYPLFADLEGDLRRGVMSNDSTIRAAIEGAFAEEIGEYQWFDDRFVDEAVTGFVDQLDKAFDPWRLEYRQLAEESERLHQHSLKEGDTKESRLRRDVLYGRLESMREGSRGFYTYGYLGSQGFLPNYAFPSKSTTVSFFDSVDDLSRDVVLALREYAPGNSIYYRGRRHAVQYARPQTREGAPAFEPLLTCAACGQAYLGDKATNTVACNNCGSTIVTHPNPRALPMPDMLARRRQGITADEEERQRLGYVVEPHYDSGSEVRRFQAMGEDESPILSLIYEHNGHLIVVNRGERPREAGELPKGFSLCTACNSWLLGEEALIKHATNGGEGQCPRGAKQEDVVRGIELFTDSRNDVVSVECPLPDYVSAEDAEAFYVSLLHTFTQGLTVALNLDTSEMGGFLAPYPDDPVQQRVVLYETTEGGAGAALALTQQPRFAQVMERALEILHEGEEGCEKACYECLCTFYNQQHHEILDRHLILPLLRNLRRAQLLGDSGTSDDGDRYQELYEKCQSTFEEKVLQEIKRRGLPLPTDAQRTIYDKKGIPVASADFFYEPKGLVVFVDGPPHNKDYITSADEGKRKRLKALGYRVLAISYDEMNDGLQKLQHRI